MPGTLKRLSIATAVAAAIGAATLPGAASAGPVEDLVGGVQKTVNDTLNSVNGLLGGSGGGGQGAPAPAPAPAPQAEGGSTAPAIDGTNPHGQGEVLDLTTDAPILGDVVGTAVVGQARGEQDAAGNYQGNVTLVSVSGLGIDVSFPENPLADIQTILDGLCDGTGQQVCLEVLNVSSDTDDNGSTNHFEVADANLLGGTVTASAMESNGNISDDGSCQTADGNSTVADAGVGGLLGDDVVSAETIESESHSEACNNGFETATADSDVADLTALDLNLGGLVETTLVGCQTGDTVDDPFSIAGGIVGAALVDVLSGVCNGDDTDGAQADSPYNVRKALGADILELLTTLLDSDLALDVSTSESLARAPGDDGPECPDPNNPDCPQPPECPDPDNPDCPDGPDRDECPDPDNPDCPDTTVSSGGPGGPSADDEPDDELAFTGADMGTLGAIGLGVMAIGLGLMGIADRRRRTVA